VLAGVYAAFLAFAVPGLLLAVLRRDRGVLKASYPFGPFLLAGALAGVVLGAPLWSGLVSGSG
jgi:leader peptidase (prepilin peptidase)/N-methyltransferase